MRQTVAGQKKSENDICKTGITVPDCGRTGASITEVRQTEVKPTISEQSERERQTALQVHWQKLSIDDALSI